MASAIAETFGWRAMLENLDEHPFLSDYYSDMRRWGFHTVAAFLIRALTLQAQLREQLESAAVCQDWYFAEHYDIYGVHTFEEGIIDAREQRTCEELHRYLMRHMIPPDLVIVLDADAQTLHRRVQARRRPSEADIPLAYIEHLVERYADWRSSLAIRHIVIDSTTVDFAHDDDGREAVLERVKWALKA